MRGALRSRWELVASPVFALCVAVLWVNDHVLKAASPGLVTGKLSDVAGVAMVAILLVSVTGWPRFGCGATAIGFTLLKTVPAVASMAAPVLGGVTRTDPTDLVALGVLPAVSWWAARRRSAAGARANDGRVRGQALLVRIVVVAAAVLTLTATSCDEEGVSSVVVADGGVLVADAYNRYESVDGGRTWRDSDLTEVGSGEPSCTPDGTCYEVRGGVVTAVDGGRETVLLAVGSGTVDELPDLDGITCGLDPWQSVAAVDLADGRHLVVAMGAYGVLHRGPDDQWEWVSVGRFGLPDAAAGDPPFGIPVHSTVDPGIDWFLWVARALLLLVPAGVFAFAVPLGAIAARYGRRRVDGIRATCAGGALVLLLAIGAMVVAGTSDLAPVLLLLAAVVLGVMSAVLLVSLLISFGRPRPGGAPVVRPKVGPPGGPLPPPTAGSALG